MSVVLAAALGGVSLIPGRRDAIIVPAGIRTGGLLSLSLAGHLGIAHQLRKFSDWSMAATTTVATRHIRRR